MREECSHGNLARSCGQCDTECALSDAHKRIAELERDKKNLKGLLDIANSRLINYEATGMELIGSRAKEILREELAAAQATISRMRDLLTKIEYLEADNGCIMSLNECSGTATEALALPNDRSALDAMLAEAEKRGVQWIDPNDKTRQQYLPHIGEPCLFAHDGRTYYGQHTGGSFQTGRGVTARSFPTWDCVWMPLPEPPAIRQAAERSE